MEIKEIYIVLAILSAFVWTGYRNMYKSREVSLKQFGKIIFDFVFFPFVVLYEEIRNG